MDKADTHYTVLARRFRPQTFDEVIGQQHVAQALKNAILSGRVAHAYLFSGVRGVGKTSMARIFAKALNCPNAVDAVPCNGCELCDSISAGNDVDVMEIDGASNTGVDNIRDLRANVGVKSMRSRYKIYIIDEVHMLSKPAFNALLKTLEEPPPNVKFMFCTTEPQKILDTILSRCQRFDFAAIDTQNIIQRLQEIAEIEGFQVEPDALELVARRAGGSMRDSQSLFDQLLAFGGETVNAEDVHRLLGTASDERLLNIVTALSRRDRDGALTELDAALSDGVQLSELMDQMIHYFRDLMIVASNAEQVPLQSLSEIRRPELSPQAESWGLATIVAALQILVEAKGRMFRAVYARALAELALVRISLLEDLEDLAVLARNLASGGGTAAETGATAAPRQERPGNRSPAANRTTDRPERNLADRGTPASKPMDTAETNAQKNTGPEVSLEISDRAKERVLAQLVEYSDDATCTHLKSVSIAISGPNQVDLIFSPSYHFSRQFCDRPEIRGKLESILNQAAGKSVKITIRTDHSAPPRETKSEQHATETKRTGAIDLAQADKDEFVQQVVSIFNGTIKQVDPLK